MMPSGSSWQSAPVPPTRTRGWLLVRLGGDHFGLPVEQLQEVVGVVGILRVSGAPEQVRGAMLFRGRRIPVVDLVDRMGFGKGSVLDGRVVVVRSRGRSIGLLVDGVDRMVGEAASSVEPLPETVRDGPASCLNGVLRLGERLVMLLDVEQLLCVEGQ